MNLFPFSRRRAERFAQLLDEANGAPPPPRPVPRRRRELSTLVELGRQIRTAGAEESDAGIDPRFRTDLRAMLMATAEREGVGDHGPAAAPVAARPAIPAPRRTAGVRRGHRPPGTRPRRHPDRHRRRRHHRLRHVGGERERDARRRPVPGETLHRTRPARARQLRPEPGPALPRLRPYPPRRGAGAQRRRQRPSSPSSTRWTRRPARAYGC